MALHISIQANISKACEQSDPDLAEGSVIPPGTGGDKDGRGCQAVSAHYLVGDCHKAISHPSPWFWGGQHFLPSPLFRYGSAASFRGCLENRLAVVQNWLLPSRTTQQAGGLSFGSSYSALRCGTRDVGSGDHADLAYVVSVIYNLNAFGLIIFYQPNSCNSISHQAAAQGLLEHLTQRHIKTPHLKKKKKDSSVKQRDSSLKQKSD